MHISPWLAALLLIGAANGAPILARWGLGPRLALPLDRGRIWRDGRPLLGPTKTLLGLVAGIVAAVAGAYLLSLPLVAGWLIGCFAMLGDLVSSFLKRRLAMPSSSRAPGLDQIPESLFPAVAVRGVLGLDWWQVVIVVCVFLLLDVFLSPLLHRLHVRRRPY